LTILIDTREPIIMYESLSKRGLSVERITLEAGDYEFKDTGIGIERKTVNDYLQSIYKRTIWEQLYKLKQCYLFPLLLIEGDVPVDARKAYTFRVNVATILMRWRIPVYRTANMEDTILLLEEMYLRRERPIKQLYARRRLLKKEKEPRAGAIVLLSSLPFIGLKSAHYILHDYSPSQFMSLSPEEMSSYLTGISLDRAKIIRSILDYKHPEERRYGR